MGVYFDIQDLHGEELLSIISSSIQQYYEDRSYNNYLALLPHMKKQIGYIDFKKSIAINKRKNTALVKYTKINKIRKDSESILNKFIEDKGN